MKKAENRAKFWTATDRLLEEQDTRTRNHTYTRFFKQNCVRSESNSKIMNMHLFRTPSFYFQTARIMEAKTREHLCNADINFCSGKRTITS